MNVPWTSATAAQIGVDWLLDAIRPAGRFGRRAHDAARAFGPGEEAAASAAGAGVAGAARTLEPDRLERLRGVLERAPDPRGAVLRAQAGEVLGDADFFELAAFLDALDMVRAGCAGTGLDAPLFPADVAAALAPGRGEHGRFYLDDRFDPALARARAAAAVHRARYDAARSRCAERIANLLGEPVRDGEFVLMRDRLNGPLPDGVRVLLEAPTYLLCEVALDADAQRALAEVEGAEVAVARCEEAVRARLGTVVSAAAPALLAVGDRLGSLDVLLARARFAQRYACHEARIVSEPEVSFEAARYLPLAGPPATGAPAYQPISLALRGAATLGGPNMGGKSTALRTCGFLAACAALGLPVPARAARLGLFDEIVWLGGAESAASEPFLSSFASEVTAARAFFERDARAPLVLIDEFGRTTAPREGGALLGGLLARLAQRGAVALAATHLLPRRAPPGVASFATVDYAIVPVDDGSPPHANAIRLAEDLGLDPGVIAFARDLL